MLVGEQVELLLAGRQVELKLAGRQVQLLLTGRASLAGQQVEVGKQAALAGQPPNFQKVKN